MMQSLDQSIDRYYESWFGINAAYDKWAAQNGIATNALYVLLALNDQQEPLSQRAICLRMQLSKQTVSGVIEGFVKKGYVTSTPAPDDRRQKNVVLTAAGRRYAETVCGALREFERRAMGDLTAKQRQALVAGSECLCAALRRALEL